MPLPKYQSSARAVLLLTPSIFLKTPGAATAEYSLFTEVVQPQAPCGLKRPPGPLRIRLPHSRVPAATILLEEAAEAQRGARTCPGSHSEGPTLTPTRGPRTHRAAAQPERGPGRRSSTPSRAPPPRRAPPRTCGPQAPPRARPTPPDTPAASTNGWGPINATGPRALGQEARGRRQEAGGGRLRASTGGRARSRLRVPERAHQGAGGRVTEVGVSRSPSPGAGERHPPIAARAPGTARATSAARPWSPAAR